MYDFILKMVAIGDENVGKSTVLASHNFDKFFGDTYPTIGVDFFTTAVTWNKKKIKMHIWDCSGKKPYFDIINSYFRSVVAAIIFFDLSNRDSFNNLEKWIYEFNRTKQKYSYIMIVGNYKDGQINITGDEIRKICNKYQAGYAEVNCHNPETIKKMLIQLGETILEEYRMNPEWYKSNQGFIDKNSYTRLGNIEEEKSGCSSKCCVIF